MIFFCNYVASHTSTRTKYAHREYLQNILSQGGLVKGQYVGMSDVRPLLDNAGSVSHEEAVIHAETEFKKHRTMQVRLFESDFDKYLGELPFDEEGAKASKDYPRVTEGVTRG